MDLDRNSTLIARGEIVRIDRRNVDKTRRNPKWILDVFLHTVEIQRHEQEVDLPDTVKFTIKEKDLNRMQIGHLAVGDQVIFEGIGTDPRTPVFKLHKAQRC